MKSELTIAIITKNRPAKLDRCLESICQQNLLPKSVLMIDNDPRRTSYPVFKKYSKKLPLHYFHEKKSGVPYCRNKALSKTETRYLGFVDDDCVLDNKWTKSAIDAFQKNKDITYVCGKTNLYNNKNIFAIAQYSHDSYWYVKKVRKYKQTVAANFDTKNVVLDMKAIRNNSLKFDPKCGIGNFDSADFDFGLQLNHLKLRGIYSDKLQLAHEETSTFKRYVMRAYYRGKIAGYINIKWKLDDKFVKFPEKNIFIWVLPKDKPIFTNCNSRDWNGLMEKYGTLIRKK